MGPPPLRRRVQRQPDTRGDARKFRGRHTFGAYEVMTTEPSRPATRYLTLRDYRRVVSRYWIMIAAITALGGAAAYVGVPRQNPVYKASSDVGFQDPAQHPTLTE